MGKETTLISSLICNVKTTITTTQKKKEKQTTKPTTANKQKLQTPQSLLFGELINKNARHSSHPS